MFNLNPSRDLYPSIFRNEKPHFPCHICIRSCFRKISEGPILRKHSQTEAVKPTENRHGTMELKHMFAEKNKGSEVTTYTNAKLHIEGFIHKSRAFKHPVTRQYRVMENSIHCESGGTKICTAYHN